MARERLVARLSLLKSAQVAEELPDSLPEFPTFDDPVLKFREELERVGGIFLEGRGEGAIAAALERVLTERAGNLMVWEDSGLFAKHGIPARLPGEELSGGDFLASRFESHRVRFPVEVETFESSSRPIDQIEILVTSAALGVAETGSILEKTGSGRGRVLSILPPVHVALLSERDLVMNHVDWLGEPALGKGESAQLLITGPSRTADIEKTLIIGVHGPQYLYLILTD